VVLDDVPSEFVDSGEEAKSKTEAQEGRTASGNVIVLEVIKGGLRGRGISPLQLVFLGKLACVQKECKYTY